MKTTFFEFLLKLLNDQSGNISLTGDGGGGDPPPADGGGDPAPPSGGEPPAPPVSDPEPSITPEPAPNDFLVGLEDDIKNDPSLKVFMDADGKFNVPNALKSYVHAQRKMGEKGIHIPTKASTPEDWDNFHNMMRDADIEKYEIKNTLEDGQTLDDEMFTGFKALAHKSGLTSEQAQNMLNWYNEKTTNVIGENQKQADSAYEKEANTLKSDWGDGFKNEMKMAQRAIREFGDDKLIKSLKETGLDKNITLIRLFNKIGHGLMEDKFDTESHGDFGITKSDAERKINAIMGDQTHAYWNADHASHKNAVDEMQKLTAATMTA